MTIRRKITVGIDLGTTNTVVASNFEAMCFGERDCIMPSAVAFSPSGSTIGVRKPTYGFRLYDARASRSQRSM